MANFSLFNNIFIEFFNCLIYLFIYIGRYVTSSGSTTSFSTPFTTAIVVCKAADPGPSFSLPPGHASWLCCASVLKQVESHMLIKCTHGWHNRREERLCGFVRMELRMRLHRDIRGKVGIMGTRQVGQVNTRFLKQCMACNENIALSS